MLVGGAEKKSWYTQIRLFLQIDEAGKWIYLTTFPSSQWLSSHFPLSLMHAENNELANCILSSLSRKRLRQHPNTQNHNQQPNRNNNQQRKTEPS